MRNNISLDSAKIKEIRNNLCRSLSEGGLKQVSGTETSGFVSRNIGPRHVLSAWVVLRQRCAFSTAIELSLMELYHGTHQWTQREDSHENRRHRRQRPHRQKGRAEPSSARARA